MNINRMWVMAVAATMLAIACSDNGGADGGTGGGTNTGGGTSTGGGSGGGNGAFDGGSDGGSTQLTPLSEGQSVAVLASINAGEIQIAQSVVQRLSNLEAQAFAQQMITEHTSVQEQADTLIQQQGVTRTASVVSLSVDTAGAQMITQLAPLNGVALDVTYMQGQIAMHQQALSLIDCLIVPALQNTALRTFVATTVRPSVAGHLTSAAAIVTTLNDGGQGTTVKTDAAQCNLACVDQEDGGLFPDDLRTSACAGQ